MNERLLEWKEKEEAFDVPALLIEALSGASVTGITGRMRRYRGLLLEHFQEEEREGGYFEELVRELPDAKDAVASLVREHEEILDAMHELHQEAEAGRRHTHEVLAMREALLKRLKRHQHAESELLKRALSD